MKIIRQEEFKDIVKSGKYVVDFYADWCGPCKMIAPYLESLESELNGEGINFMKINVDDNPELSEEMGIKYIPFVAVFADGEKKDSFFGYKDKDALREFIKNSIN